jgi:hypothetical protein
MLGRDFTQFPVGTEIDGKKIQVCPHCGMHGLIYEEDGQTLYDHGYIMKETTQRLDYKYVICPQKKRQQPRITITS